MIISKHVKNQMEYKLQEIADLIPQARYACPSLKWSTHYPGGADVVVRGNSYEYYDEEGNFLFSVWYPLASEVNGRNPDIKYGRLPPPRK